MKKIIKYIFICSILFMLSGCTKKEYVGHWCNYEETGTIIVLLDHEISSSNKDNIEDIINTYQDINTYDFISKEDLASTTSVDINTVYDTYFIYFENTDSIDDALITLQNTKGIYSATKENIKSNVSLYNLKNDNTFEYQEAIGDEELIIKGKYKIKDNKIEFKSEEKVNNLYLKDSFICKDETCNKIYVKTDASCEVN